VNIELLGKFGEGLFTADGGKGHLRFESRAMVPAGSSRHGPSPVLSKIADLQAETPLMKPVQISRATSVSLNCTYLQSTAKQALAFIA